MNSVLNGKIHTRTPYSDIYIGGSPDDSGICIGSALFGLNYMLGQQSAPRHLKHNYFGRSYSDDEVWAELNRRKLRFSELEKVPATVARILRDRKIVGFYQGKSEFGQRVLGNRSILADPSVPEIKDLVNATVK